MKTKIKAIVSVTLLALTLTATIWNIINLKIINTIGVGIVSIFLWRICNYQAYKIRKGK